MVVQVRNASYRIQYQNFWEMSKKNRSYIDLSRTFLQILIFILQFQWVWSPDSGLKIDLMDLKWSKCGNSKNRCVMVMIQKIELSQYFTLDHVAISGCIRNTTWNHNYRNFAWKNSNLIKKENLPLKSTNLYEFMPRSLISIKFHILQLIS